MGMLGWCVSTYAGGEGISKGTPQGAKRPARACELRASLKLNPRLGPPRQVGILPRAYTLSSWDAYSRSVGTSVLSGPVVGHLVR